jgi:hypothetical protein
MRLENYLEEKIKYDDKTRSSVLDLAKGREFIYSSCSKALDAPYAIYRDSATTGDVLLVEPSKYERYSANTFNYYTLMIDNFPEWQKYPKRSKSIICSTNPIYAEAFGENLYKVFPIDGARIGVCPNSDIWPTNIGGKAQLSDLVEAIDDLLIIFYNNILHEAKPELIDRDYNKFKKAMELIDKNFEKFAHEYKNTGQEYYSKKYYCKIWNELKYFSKKVSSIDFLRKIFNPETCKFELKTSGDSLPLDREVWIEDKSVLVNRDVWKKIFY